MTRRDQFPHAFAVTNTMGSNGPTFRFLTSAVTRQRENGNPCVSITDAQWARSMSGRDYITLPSQYWDQNIYHIAVVNSNGSINVWNYWYLPYYFPIGRSRMPIIEFQYKSWLPSPSFQLPMRNTSLPQYINAIEVCNAINRQRMHTLRVLSPLGAPFPARYRQAFRPPVAESHNLESQNHLQDVLRNLEIRLQANQSSNLNRPEDISEEEFLEIYDAAQNLESLLEEIEYEDQDQENLPEAFRVHDNAEVVQRTRALPLPQHVGALLLQNARSGADACPITATRYSECGSLSVTSCFHIFSTDSLERWRTEGRNTCPTCRTEIVNVITG